MEAPAITDFINEAWPGQSTIVTYKYSLLNFSINSFNLSTKLEKPRSIVIPFSLEIGLWSNEAVEAIVVKILVIEVLPESICPMIPIFKFWIFSKEIFFISS